MFQKSYQKNDKTVEKSFLKNVTFFTQKTQKKIQKLLPTYNRRNRVRKEKTYYKTQQEIELS